MAMQGTVPCCRDLVHCEVKQPDALASYPASVAHAAAPGHYTHLLPLTLKDIEEQGRLLN